MLPYTPKEFLAYSLAPTTWAECALGFTADPWQRQALLTPKNLCLIASRQSGKSTVTALKCAHQALFWEKQTIVIASPSQRQASETFRRTAEFVKRALPDQRLPEDNRLSLGLSNGSRIVSVPASEAHIRGFSVNLLVVDEASRVPDDTFAALRPSTAAVGGRTLLLSTPYGKAGFFAQIALAKDAVWERIFAPASFCPRITPEFLAQERTIIGERLFRQEYECDFSEADDAAFDYEAISSAFDGDVRFGDFTGEEDKVISDEPAFANCAIG